MAIWKDGCLRRCKNNFQGDENYFTVYPLSNLSRRQVQRPRRGWNPDSLRVANLCLGCESQNINPRPFMRKDLSVTGPYPSACSRCYWSRYPWIAAVSYLPRGLLVVKVFQCWEGGVGLRTLCFSYEPGGCSGSSSPRFWPAWVQHEDGAGSPATQRGSELPCVLGPRTLLPALGPLATWHRNCGFDSFAPLSPSGSRWMSQGGGWVNPQLDGRLSGCTRKRRVKTEQMKSGKDWLVGKQMKAKES